jgi:hypothetical protein
MTASRILHMIGEPDAFKGLQKCIVNFCLKKVKLPRQARSE